MDGLKSITFVLTEPRSPQTWLTKEWKEKLSAVKQKSHLPYLIFFGEALKILNHSEDVSFYSSAYEESSAYGPCLNWTLQSGPLTMSRDHRETLSDSWQSIEVISNSFVTGGFSSGFYISWDGKFYNNVSVTLGGIAEDRLEPLKNAVIKIFRNPVIKVTDASEEEKLESELRRSSLFLNGTESTSDMDSIATLCRMLESRDEIVALEALEKLKETCVGRSDFNHKDFDVYFDAVRRVFADKNKNKYVVRKLCEYIGIWGGERFKDLLLNGLNEEDGYMETGFISALGDLGSSEAVGPIIKKCGSPSGDIRLAAVCSLQKLITEENKKQIIDCLIKLLDDADRNVRSASVDIIAAYGDSKIAAALTGCLNDENNYIRQAAAIKLGELGEMKSLKFLEERLENETEENVRKFIRRAIKKISDDGSKT